MSHYVDILTEIRDQEALVRALGRLGFQNKIESHETAQNLYGYHGDIRKQKAHVIIRRKYVGQSSNDIGYEKIADGRFKAHISEFESATGSYAGGIGKYGAEWQNKLNTYYGVERAKMAYEKRNIKYTEDVDEKECPRLRAFV
jgi:hypothetical protein